MVTRSPLSGRTPAAHHIPRPLLRLPAALSAARLASPSLHTTDLLKPAETRIQMLMAACQAANLPPRRMHMCVAMITPSAAGARDCAPGRSRFYTRSTVFTGAIMGWISAAEIDELRLLNPKNLATEPRLAFSFLPATYCGKAAWWSGEGSSAGRMR